MFRKDEQDLFLNVVSDAITQSLAATFGRDIEVRLGEPQTDAADAALVIALDGPPTRLDVEVKAHVTPALVAALAARARRPGLTLFTPRLTPAVMNACRQLGVGCADADGNLFFRLESSAVDIQGRPAKASRQFAVGSDKAARLTSRSGLQILFVLLSAPELRNEPFRAVAAAAGTSLGSVAAVFQELGRRGYVTTTARSRALHRTGELLDAWADGYRLRLFDRLRLGTFSTDTQQWWRASPDAVRAAGGQWGSETALWANDHNLRPARGILYVDVVPPSLVAKLRLRRDAQSDAVVEFRRRFWDMPVWSADVVVPAPLIYADLLADGDPRLVEAAAEFRRNDDTLRLLDEP